MRGKYASCARTSGGKEAAKKLLKNIKRSTGGPKNLRRTCGTLNTGKKG